MKPNLFVFNSDSPEDFYSKSLAYILNLLPEIGQALLQRIVALSGNNVEYFGKFIHCYFVGNKYFNGHSESRPDLLIECSKRNLFFENKLQSPLNNNQMEKHSDLTKKIKNSSLIFVSNIHYKNTKLKLLQNYIYPENADHFLWLDFLPVFKNNYRKNSLAFKILRDFNYALKQNRMISRIINNADDNLYTYNSIASHLALSQLWDLLKEIGFKLAKKSSTENTLRVYTINYRQYPLLNPRFEPTAGWLDYTWDKECINFTVLSKGDSNIIDQNLIKFQSDKECTFIVNSFKSSTGYNYHGHFLLPINFSNGEIDFQRLIKPLNRMLDFFRNNN